MFWMFVSICISILCECNCIRVKNLKVPEYGDPREPVEMICEYDLQDDSLQSVKWFRDNEEFYQYRPELEKYQTYPANGIQDVGGACTTTQCFVQVVLTPVLSTSVYKCEVSGEKPRFHVASAERNLTVIAYPHSPPKIFGRPDKVMPNKEIQLNCSCARSLPGSDIFWYIDEQQHNGTAYGENIIKGLSSVWSTIRVTLGYFDTKHIECKCRTKSDTPIYKSTVMDLTTINIYSHGLSNYSIDQASKFIISLVILLFYKYIHIINLL